MQIMFGRLHFKRFFMDVFRNLKILEESCHILSQYGATQTLRPFLHLIMGLTYDLEY